MTNGTNRAELLTDLHDFLNSSATTVEWMSDALRVAVSIPTPLEEILRAAVNEGRQIVLAGTAGSGKTHLLRTASLSPTYRVVPDLAALPEADWEGLFRQKSVLVAGNEGAFLRGRHRKYYGFDAVIEALHAIQQGNDEPTESGPTVIDAAAFNPAGSGALSAILRLNILKEYVESRGSGAARAAWVLLEDDLVLKRVDMLVELASTASETDGFTFRQLWQFVADLVLAPGKTGMWFDSLFNGTSEVSERVARALPPSSIALAHVANWLWHGDLHRLKGAFVPAAEAALETLLPEVLRTPNDEVRLAVFERLRVLAALGLRVSPLDQILYRSDDLWSRVRRFDHKPLLTAINRYFAYGLLEFGDDLELWLQHTTERRLTKPSAQVSLGVARANEFCIVRSVVAANRPNNAPRLRGGRVALRHNGGAFLFVTKDLVNGLLEGRSHRTMVRKDVEFDWRLGRFFEKVSATASTSDRLTVAEFDFQARSAGVFSWKLSDDTLRRVSH